jgi:hypothetical protein
MQRLLLIGLGLAALVRLVDLQRRLEAARSRGDMYRDIALRLDRQLSEHRQQGG